MEPEIRLTELCSVKKIAKLPPSLHFVRYSTENQFHSIVSIDISMKFSLSCSVINLLGNCELNLLKKTTVSFLKTYV